MRTCYLTLVLSVVACGGGDSDGNGTDGGSNSDAGATAGTFGADCDLQCRTEGMKTACNGEPPANCADDCAANAEGLDTVCGKCVVSDTTLSSTGCAMQLGDVSDCETECLAGTHSPQTEFQAECDAQCRAEGTKTVCSGEPPATCASDCATNASGLDILCGKCVVSLTTLSSFDCTIQPGNVSDCQAFCL